LTRTLERSKPASLTNQSAIAPLIAIGVTPGRRATLRKIVLPTVTTALARRDSL
jgi:hypothetical protein